jgi:hypothetical protein
MSENVNDRIRRNLHKDNELPFGICASSSFRCASFAIRISLIALLMGCGPPRNITVVGSVVRDGKPLALSSTGVVQVTIKPDVGPDQEFTTYVGRCDAAGKFEIQDVPPGRYVFGIEQLDPTPQNDKLNGALTYGNSKIKRDLDGKAPVAIDLAKPGG